MLRTTDLLMHGFCRKPRNLDCKVSFADGEEPPFCKHVLQPFEEQLDNLSNSNLTNAELNSLCATDMHAELARSVEIPGHFPHLVYCKKLITRAIVRSEQRHVMAYVRDVVARGHSSAHARGLRFMDTILSRFSRSEQLQHDSFQSLLGSLECIRNG